MAYSGPPGVPSHPSLPPRPPASGAAKPSKFASSFAPATSSYATSSAPSYASQPAYPGAPSAQYGASQPPASYGAFPQTSAVSGRAGYGGNQQQQSTYGQGYGAAQQSAGGTGGYGQQYSAPPQIRNPFPVPGEASSDYDPEMAAQIAAWQSAYVPKDSAAEAAAGGKPGRAGGAAGTATTSGPAAATGETGGDATMTDAGGAESGDRKKTVYRAGGGKKWQDNSLLEWDPTHLRLFVGNLAGEVTDESLLKAFSRWRSVSKAKVVRDNRTSKSKGYGFVSFADADDFFQAAKEMNGKYIQSHPVVVRKATTEIKVANVKEDRRGGKKDKKNKNKGGNGGGGGDKQDGYNTQIGPLSGGVHKHGKTKGGLKLLG
jgi:hypothetical protein